MRTAVYHPPKLELSPGERFVVLAEEKEVDFEFFGTLYAVIKLLRTKTAVAVQTKDGRELFRHNGKNIVSEVEAFTKAVVGFEEFLLEEQTLGYRQALGWVRSTLKSNAELAALQAQQNAETPREEERPE